MFKWRIISRSNIHGKVHTFQKDFDDYDAYQSFLGEHPEYSPQSALERLWNPWSYFDRALQIWQWSTPFVDTKYLPEGFDLEKYEKRRAEKRQNEEEKIEKKQSLELTKVYLTDYLGENPDDSDAKSDLEKIESELKELV